MSILIFNRSHSFDFTNWLADSGHDLYLFTDRVMRDMHRYRGVELFPGFDEAGLSEMRALQMAKQHSFARILCHSEYDLLRAANLREQLKVTGQSVASVQAYRNKFHMKELAAKAHIPIAPQALLESPLHLLSFIEEHGLPVVVKPVDGGGSRGVEILEEAAQVSHFLKQWPVRPFMVEKFVAGQLHHIDGLVRHGHLLFASVGSYFSDGCLNFHTQQSNGCYLLGNETALQRELIQFTQKVIAALPTSPELGFHAEAFVTISGEIILCEIAARTAGGWIVELIEAAYGINLNREWVRLCAGIEPERCLAKVPMERYTGFLNVPPRLQGSAQLRQLPQFEWCLSYIHDVSKHLNGSHVAGSIEFASMLMVEGNSSTQVRERLCELDIWLQDSSQT